MGLIILYITCVDYYLGQFGWLSLGPSRVTKELIADSLGNEHERLEYTLCSKSSCVCQSP